MEGMPFCYRRSVTVRIIKRLLFMRSRYPVLARTGTLTFFDYRQDCHGYGCRSRDGIDSNAADEGVG